MSEEKDKFSTLLGWIRRIMKFALIQFDREFPEIKEKTEGKND